MKLYKHITAALLALALLAGCSGVPGADKVGELLATPGPAPTLPPAPDPVPQTLCVGGSRSRMGRALQAYAAANNVSLTGDGESNLVVLDLYPESGATGEGPLLDLTADPMLAAAAARAGLDTAAPLYAFPAGRCLYGYWTDTAVLAALLGEDYQNDLRAATWEEWSAFAAAVTAWIADPAAAAETELTLNGNPYTLPAEKPAAAAALEGVFYTGDKDWGTDGPMFAPALLAAGAARSEETLIGALNGLCSAVLLESANGCAGSDAAASLGAGQALFVRRPLCELTGALDADTLARLTVLPVKSDLVESDLFTEEYNLTGLLNYPVLTDAGWLAIPAGRETDSLKAGAAALLWLYGSAGGEKALTEDELLITPWDTASDTSPLGAWQVSQVESGILPAPALTEAQLDGVNAAVDTLRAAAAADGSDKALREARAAFLQSAVAALADPAAGQSTEATE